MSTIKLYRNCKITEEKNFQVDQIYNYLGSFSGGDVKVFNNCQYIKQGLDTEVKVTLDQTYLDKQWTNMFNYCSIEMDNGGLDNTYYYFIREKKWISKDAIRLVLRLDVLNTFNGQYTLTNKTTIQREHKDRFVKGNKIEISIELGSWALWVNPSTHEVFGSYKAFTIPSELRYITITPEILKVNYQGIDYFVDHVEYIDDTNLRMYVRDVEIPVFDTATLYIVYNKLNRIIDLYPENIDNVKYKTYENTIYDNSQMRWYLVYKTSEELDPNTTQPVNTYLYPQDQITVKYASQAAYNSIDSVNEVVGAYGYFITKYLNSADKVYASDNGTTWTEIMNLSQKITWNIQEEDTLFLAKSGTKIACYKIHFYQKGGFGPGELKVSKTSIGEYTYIRIGDSSDVNYKRTSSAVAVTEDWIRTNYLTTTNQGTTYTWSGTTPTISTVDVTSIDTLDRTQSTLVKVIELPYCPVPIVKDDNSFVLDNYDKSVWEYDSGKKCFLLLTNTLTTKLGQVIDTEMNPLKELFISGTIVPNQPRNDYYESKLYHSEFYQPKFVYDSFDYSVNLENYDIQTPNTGWKINYVVSNTCNSRFLFEFKSMINKYSTSDYDNLMIVNRNNDITCSNSNYLNYLRNGYNYDLKNRELAKKKEYLNIASGAAKGAISGAMSSGGNPYGAAAGLVIGTGTAIANAYIGDIQSQMAIEQKLAELSHQSASVSGSDDIDLLRYYTNGNKMKYCIYTLSDRMKQKVADLFYYCGYNCGYQNVPNTTSRYWFNFIQCDPVFDEDRYTVKMGKECKEELVNKYKSGVTVLHRNNGMYDFDQVKENWENWLIR